MIAEVAILASQQGKQAVMWYNCHKQISAEAVLSTPLSVTSPKPVKEAQTMHTQDTTSPQPTYCCNKCGVTKPLADFYVRKSGRRAHACKSCARAIQNTNSAKNREREAARGRAWRAKNPDRVRQFNVAYYAENRDAVLDQKKDYARRKPDVVRTNAKRRKARVRGAEGTITAEQWQSLIEYFGGRCAYCNVPTENPTMDHLIPIVQGGRHDVTNVVPACMTCNCRKGPKPLWFFVLTGKFLEGAKGMGERVGARVTREIGG